MNNTLQQLEAQYRAAKASVEKSLEDMRKLEKTIQEMKEQPKEIGLKKPRPGSCEAYWSCDFDGKLSVIYAGSLQERYYRGFSSTNLHQAEAFYDAIDIMAELRCQPGIVIPNLCESSFTLYYNGSSCDVRIANSGSYSFGGVSPHFKSEKLAFAAADNVGRERVIQAIKTFSFLTPESRGEVE